MTKYFSFTSFLSERDIKMMSTTLWALMMQEKEEERQRKLKRQQRKWKKQNE
jgi:hypothetical protein